MRKLFALVLALVVLGVATTAMANPNGTINPLGNPNGGVSPWSYDSAW